MVSNPVDFWIEICSAQNTECATVVQQCSIPSAVLTDDSQTSKCYHSTGPLAQEL